MGIASSGLFVYAGFLLWNYKKKGVWMGFGAVGINVVDGVLASILLGMIGGNGDSTEPRRFLGKPRTCGHRYQCSMLRTIVALPLLMNGNDLDDD